MNKVFYLLTILVVSAAAGAVQAQGWYQVEVIVFDYLNPDLDGELWFENPGLPQRDGSIELIREIPDVIKDVPTGINQQVNEQEQGRPVAEQQEVRPVPYLSLPEDKFRLKDIYRNLRLSSNYRPLLHEAWQQPKLNASGIRYVHLEKLVADEQEQIEIRLDQPDQELIDESYEPPRLFFDGKLRIRISDIYLYADVDFAYFPEDFSNLLNVQLRNAGRQYEKLVNYDADYVRLSQSRRIYLNELEFFDHPLFGILIQVTSFEPGS